MAGFHSSLYKAELAIWNIYKRKNIYGMYESESKSVAFHVMKPCIIDMGFHFLRLFIEDQQEIDYNM